MTTLAVPVDVIQTNSITSNLYIRTSRSRFFKMKTGLMIFIGKREKTKKHLKIAAYFSSHNACYKKKGTLTFMYLLLKVCCLEQLFFKAFPYREDDKSKIIYCVSFILEQNLQHHSLCRADRESSS